jgi:hypothetical protein
MTRKHNKNKCAILLYLANTYQTAPHPSKNKDSTEEKATEDAVHVCQHCRRKFCTDNLQSGSSEFYWTNVLLNVGQINVYSRLIIY